MYVSDRARQMWNYGISILAGAIAVGWLSVIYAIGFNYLYLSISIKEKVEFCGRFFEQYGTCKGVAYFFLWVSETPILLVTFLTVAMVLYGIRCYFKKLEIEKRYVVLGYLMGYLALIELGEYGDVFPLISWYNAGVSVYHGAWFFVCLWAASRLIEVFRALPKEARHEK